MEKEDAQAQLRRGIKMKEGDIDAYVAQFEELARMAGYRLDEPQTIDTFTVGLPLNLYLKTFKLDQPRTYQQWRELEDGPPEDNCPIQMPWIRQQEEQGEDSRGPKKSTTMHLRIHHEEGLCREEEEEGDVPNE